MSFSRQLVWYYLVVFTGSVFLLLLLYSSAFNRYYKKGAQNTVQYGLQIAGQSVDSIVDTADNCSRMISYSSQIQDALQETSAITYQDRTEIQEAIWRMTSCYQGISSVYLFDQGGDSYTSGNISDVEIIRKKLKNADSFREALEEFGSGSSTILSFQNAGQIGKTGISFVRLVRNLNTLDDIGIVVVNIENSQAEDALRTVSGQTGMDLAVIDHDSNLIACSDKAEWLVNMHTAKQLGIGFTRVSHDGKDYYAGEVEVPDGGVTVIGALSRSSALTGIQPITMVSVILIFLGMGLCVLGAVFMTRRIMIPLNRVITSMGKIGKGDFSHIQVAETNRELDILQNSYNHMLDDMVTLVDQKVEEQRLRRKYELSLLQEQIKPHFLYNTFDSVCALAKMGRTDDVYRMMQALGQYYRDSLHKGKTIVTVREELSIVINYLIVQSYRFDDVFQVVYDTDESVMDCHVIKLILQPLVENAINHGFREAGLTGTITIRAKDDGDYILLQVEDDGAGMPAEKAQEILHAGIANQESRFGLPGTIQRIRLYYRDDVKKKLVDIESDEGMGTLITIHIPKEVQDVEGSGGR